MNAFSASLPSQSTYFEQLIRKRREVYVAELAILRVEVTRKQWQEESAQILAEMTRIMSQPLSALAPDSDVFHGLARARSRYNRDIAQMLRAASIPASLLHQTWVQGVIQKSLAFLFPSAEAPARPQPAMA